MSSLTRSLLTYRGALIVVFLQSSPVDVRVKFDMTALPQELTQYQAHYCNYTLRVPSRESS